MLSTARSVGGRVIKLQRNNVPLIDIKGRGMAGTKGAVAVCWLRNDLRYHDNEVLLKANQNASHVVPVYCFDPRHFLATHNFGLAKTGPHRAKFIRECVEDLRNTLRAKGSDLVVRVGKPEEELPRILQSIQAPTKHLVYQEEVTKEERDVEAGVVGVFRREGVTVHSFWGATLYHKADLPFSINELADTYTGFRKVVEGRARVRGPLAMPSTIKPMPQNVDPGTIPNLSQLGVQDPPSEPRTAFPYLGGESAGLARVRQYLWGTDNVAKYKETRNGLIGEAYSTKFSPWLAHGCVSPRYIHSEVKRYEGERVANNSTYWVIFEMIWRDYFRFVCLRYGDRVFYPSGIKGVRQRWKTDEKLFNMWKEGRTGVPFVDANMRELARTGWMSNRGRQNVASFLIKDLGMDWRMGAEWFESMLLDHDVCSNYGNWNYSAGIGNDPRENRKFNMVKQGLDYDGEGDYVRLWVPELKGLRGGKVHTPWTLSTGELGAAGVELGHTYPRPCVVAPEWARHGGKASSGKQKSGGWTPRQGRQRGIDFYFKNNSQK